MENRLVDSPQAANLKHRISAEMAEAHEKGMAVWQLPVEDMEKFHLPMNPTFFNGSDKDGNRKEPGRYYSNGVAMYLMQKQHEISQLKDAEGNHLKNDNRWMPLFEAKKSNYLDPAPDAVIVSIPYKFRNKEKVETLKLVNYSQLNPRPGCHLPKASFKEEYRDVGKIMLTRNSFTTKEYTEENGVKHKVEGSEKCIAPDEVKEGFFDISKKAFYSARLYKASLEEFKQQKRDEYIAERGKYDEAFKEREDFILGYFNEEGRHDRKPATKEEKFLFNLCENAVYQLVEKDENAQLDSSYIIDAAKNSLKSGVAEKTVKKYITKYAPEAVRDELKESAGRMKYADYIMDGIKRDKAFQKECGKAL